MNSTKRNARIAGLLYLTLLTAPLRLIYIPTKLIVHGDPAATSANIAAHETLFRLGILSDLFTATMSIFLTLAFYRLFKGVSQFLASLIVILGSLMVAPIYFLNTVNDAAALTFATGADFLSAFAKPQRDAFVMLFLHLHHQGIVANEVFWGLWLLPIGLLIWRSRMLPRFIGVWLVLNCVAYVVVAFTGVMFPQHEEMVSNYVFPAMLAELVLMFWLLIMGAKEPAVAASA